MLSGPLMGQHSFHFKKLVKMVLWSTAGHKGFTLKSELVFELFAYRMTESQTPPGSQHFPSLSHYPMQMLTSPDGLERLGLERGDGLAGVWCVPACRNLALISIHHSPSTLFVRHKISESPHRHGALSSRGLTLSARAKQLNANQSLTQNSECTQQQAEGRTAAVQITLKPFALGGLGLYSVCGVEAGGSGFPMGHINPIEPKSLTLSLHPLWRLAQGAALKHRPQDSY
ncbi:hypothetical protein MHYP_G00176900 [Metynnis hypsauchen]